MTIEPGQTGMLWYDDDKTTTLEDKVRRAANFYAEKFNARANRCWVHPKQLAGGPIVVDGLAVRGDKKVIKNHLWLGIE